MQGNSLSFRSIIGNRNFRFLFTIVISIYMFIASLEGVKSGFQLIFAEWQSTILGMIISDSAPITGLAVGMLATALVQSSSAVVATTMVSMAGMVASGLSLEAAIQFGVPMILGANIGTTVTNTIVAFGLRRGLTNKEFNETIPIVIVDDIYEALTITIFFIGELTTKFISRSVLALSSFYIDALNLERYFSAFEASIVDIIVKDPLVSPIRNLLVSLLGQRTGGVVIFVAWFLVILYSMGMITNGLEKLIESGWDDKVQAAFDSPSKGFLTGFSITFLVGSSSVGTSLVIPFAATKIVDLKKAYPYLIGCNLATTMDPSQIYAYLAGGIVGVTLGSAHILLNVMAVFLWFISPLRFVPVVVSEWLGDKIAHNQHSAFALLAWVIGVFFVVPVIIIYLL
jgi:solute carrier family 34 (sodium-dependent phosphate cotransporter)